MDFNLQLTIALRLGLAFLLGTIIGYERTYQQKPAGSRTHSLVALASALFMIISIYGFGGWPGQRDPARIAAQVVVGMGFIGGGTIWKEGSWVKGLTTATTLWVSSALGLAAGAGLYIPAAVATALVYLGLKFYEVMKFLTGKDEWLEQQRVFEQLDLGGLKLGLERIFAKPIKFSAFNAANPYVISFTFEHAVDDTFALTLAIKGDVLTLVLLYVPEALRGRGYAKAVVRLLLEWAAKSGFKQLNLTSKPEVNEVWLKLGFRQAGESLFVYDLGSSRT